jgi:hypothetical protein
MISKAIIKPVVNIVASAGVGKVVSEIIKNNISLTSVSKLGKARIYIGSFVIGSMIEASVSKHVEERIDKMQSDWETVKVEWEKQQEKIEEKVKAKLELEEKEKKEEETE